MNITTLSKACMGIPDKDIQFITGEQYQLEYRYNERRSISYNSQALNLVSKKVSYFIYGGIYFAIAKSGAVYITEHMPFTPEGDSIEGIQALIDLGVSMCFNNEHLDTLGLKFEDTDGKEDSYIYNLNDLEAHYNAAGRSNSRRKFKKLEKKYTIRAVRYNDLTPADLTIVSALDKYWFETIKESSNRFNFYLDKISKKYNPDLMMEGHVILFFEDNETGECDAYSATEIQVNGNCIEYIRKSKIQTTSYEYITLSTLRHFNAMLGVHSLYFGSASYLSRAEKKERHAQPGLVKAKTSIPHELDWIHFF